MSDNPNEGLLSQDDIDAALTAAGVSPEKSEDSSPAPSPEPVPPATDSPAKAARGDSAGRPIGAAAAAMDDALKENAASVASAGISPFRIPELATSGAGHAQIQGIDLLRDVELDVKIELGRSRMLIDDVLRLGEGSVVELDKLAGDPVDVFVNDRLVARGEVLVLNDNFCVRINDILREELDEVN